MLTEEEVAHAFREAVAKRRGISTSTSLVHLLGGESGKYSWQARGTGVDLMLARGRGGQEIEEKNRSGALIYIPVKRWSPLMYAHASQLKARGGETVYFHPSIFGKADNTAFAHVVLVKQGRKYVLLISALQKNMETKTTSESKRRRIEKETLFHADPWQMSHGHTRHYALVTAALKIAREMKEQGIDVEVHAPHPDTTPEFMEETRARINQPFQTLGTHFGEGRVTVFEGGTQLGSKEPTEIKTINLSKPKTENARAALRRLRLG